MTQAALRVWVPACSTGQEAYSLAILIHGLMQETGGHRPVRIFATDIDADAVARARAGLYSDADLHDVPADIVRQYFVPVAGGYQVCNDIRRLCVFAEQDVLRDPPFSRLDLICCRNLLIYLDPACQEKLFATFHFALKPGGWLVLGSAESNAFGGERFVHHDIRNKIYIRRTESEPVLLLSPPGAPAVKTFSPTGDTILNESSVQREAERYLLAHYSPPAVMLDAGLNIVGFFGDTSVYVQPLPGSASFKLERMLRP